MMNAAKMLVNVLLALCLSLTLIIFSVKSAFMFKPLYYMDIKVFNLETVSGRSSTEIKETYSYIIDFLTEDNTKEFKIPNFKFSSKGKVHFYEVKRMLSSINIIFYWAIFLSFLILIILQSYIDRSFLKISSFVTLSFVSALLIEFTVNFNKSFTTFHKLFFRNNYWLFDPKTDPVIDILPEAFFLHCAIFIIITVTVLYFFLLLLYKKN